MEDGQFREAESEEMPAPAMPAQACARAAANAAPPLLPGAATAAHGLLQAEEVEEPTRLCIVNQRMTPSSPRLELHITREPNGSDASTGSDTKTQGYPEYVENLTKEELMAIPEESRERLLRHEMLRLMIQLAERVPPVDVEEWNTVMMQHINKLLEQPHTDVLDIIQDGLVCAKIRVLDNERVKNCGTPLLARGAEENRNSDG